MLVVETIVVAFNKKYIYIPTYLKNKLSIEFGSMILFVVLSIN